jgi:hypothetical protein
VIQAILGYVCQLSRNSSLKIQNSHWQHIEPATGAGTPFLMLSVGIFHRAWLHWTVIANRHAVILAILGYAYQFPRNSSLKV